MREWGVVEGWDWEIGDVKEGCDWVQPWDLVWWSWNGARCMQVSVFVKGVFSLNIGLYSPNNPINPR